MFSGLIKRREKSGARQDDRGQKLYICALAQTRRAEFYSRYGVPDTFDGRFDLMLVHIFLIMHHLMDQPESKAISQAIFDSAFRNMDQTLREMGIGDMGVPKHMRRMMKAFNGRMHSYEMAISPQRFDGVTIEGLKSSTLKDVLRRNLYGTYKDDSSALQEWVELMERYIHDNLKNLKITSEDHVIFAEPEQ